LLATAPCSVFIQRSVEAHMVSDWKDAVVSENQVIIVLAVAAFVFIVFACLVLFVVIRLRRMVNSQLRTLDNLLSVRRADQGPDTPHEPS
jgi:hypothetical protein